MSDISQSSASPANRVDTSREAIAPGPFEPNWDSLAHYQAPEWHRDAKFGIWAHWGPQCQPEAGDWYARYMYVEVHVQYKDHLARHGHPSKLGFKDIIHDWKAEHFDAEKLMALYKRAGTQEDSRNNSTWSCHEDLGNAFRDEAFVTQ